jgi:hypothetical protein
MVLRAGAWGTEEALEWPDFPVLVDNEAGFSSEGGLGSGLLELWTGPGETWRTKEGMTREEWNA